MSTVPELVLFHFSTLQIHFPQGQEGFAQLFYIPGMAMKQILLISLIVLAGSKVGHSNLTWSNLPSSDGVHFHELLLQPDDIPGFH